MDLEMKEQLLNMGFSQSEASRALNATGGKSILRATEWLLSNQSQPNPNPNPSPNPNPNANPNPNPNPTPNPNPNPKLNPNLIPSSSSSCANPPPFQPRLHRFFQSLPISDQSAPAPPPAPAPATKRSKISPSSPGNPPHEPLSERMRPRKIDDVVGQDHLLGPNSLLRSSLDSDRLPSILLWGPPGVGKTSIARAISMSASNSYRFVSLSAVSAGVKDLRDAVEEARKMKKMNKRTLLFVDEVHRFNKSQQDSFLPVIEDGSLVFIGATTENPSFHLITPLLSRSRVLKLNPLRPDSILAVLKRAVHDSERGLERSVGGSKVVVEDEAFDFLSLNCDGDARVALNALEIAATTAFARKRDQNDQALSSSQEQVNMLVSQIEPIDESSADPESNGGKRVSSTVLVVTLEDAKEALQCKHLAYDRDGEEHFNLISALHKSMRGSDANAAIYWLARMLEGGEEPLYIARRLIRFASEDVGLADPNALTQAVACYQACHFIGMPECNVNLAQCVAYLALAPKSVSVYRAIEAAQKVVKDSVGQNEGVPFHLRNAPTKLMKDIGYGKGYIYPPDNPSSSQSYLPPSLQGYKFLDWRTS